MRYSILLVLICMLSSCYAVRAYKFRKLNMMDHERMPSVQLDKSNHPYQYVSADSNQYPVVSQWLDSNLAASQTVAFLVIKNDSIVYEKYYGPYNRETLLPSYSVSKSFVSTLIAIAHEEGKIVSLHDPVTRYIPELLKNDQRFSQISVQDLLDMRSGIKWSEGKYNIKNDAIKMSFRPNIMKQLKKLRIDVAPTNHYEYKSINSLLLGIVVARATHTKLEDYFEQKLWQPLGAVKHATLNTDKKGTPLTFAGLNATARDFALLGSMFLHEGFWNGQQIVTNDWVHSSVSIDSMFEYGGYRNQWWGISQKKNFLDSSESVRYAQLDTLHRKAYVRINKNGKHIFNVREQTRAFMAKGILGQFIYVDPSKSLVMVRLGHYWSHPKYDKDEIFPIISEQY